MDQIQTNNRPIDYKKELESAAKSMILVHNPHLLIKMILRLVVQKLQISHAGMLLRTQDKDKESYVLTVSRGPLGLKIPVGFARLEMDNPLIRFFSDKEFKIVLHEGTLQYDEIKRFLDTAHSAPEDLKLLFQQIMKQMDLINVFSCVPILFREDLLGVLLLGKKKNGEPLNREELDFFLALVSDVAMALRNARLFKQLEDELQKRQKLFLNTTVALATAIEAKDRYTHGHTERVTHISLEIAQCMKRDFVNIDDKFLENLHIAALLHDIGKIGVPESILNKEGSLNEEEWIKMKAHPVIGATILEPIAELEHAILGVLHHHERYDGKGYPGGLSDGYIPMTAAIIAVADSYDAMTTDRPYRKAKTKEEAIIEIKTLSGLQFHPQVVNAFLKIVQEGSF